MGGNLAALGFLFFLSPLSHYTKTSVGWLGNTNAKQLTIVSCCCVFNKLLSCTTVTKTSSQKVKKNRKAQTEYVYLNLLRCANSILILTPRLCPACCRDGRGGKHCRWGVPSGSTAWMIWRNSLKMKCGKKKNIRKL